jgi:transcriptional regulator with XRE-family HTH domain
MLNRALRLLRTYHQLSQVQLAGRLGISNSYLSEIEKGETKEPTLELLNKYADIFNMPVSSILLFSERINADAKPGTKLKIASAEKILRLLEWMEERRSVEETG